MFKEPRRRHPDLPLGVRRTLDVVSRHNARHRARAGAVRALLLPLPEKRTSDYEYTTGSTPCGASRWRC